MRTVSLRRRSVVAATVVVACALTVTSLFVTLALRAQLERDLDTLLEDRVTATRVLAEELAGVALVERMQVLGIRATVLTPEGDTLESAPTMPRTSGRLASPRGSPVTLKTQEVLLPDGSVATVAVARDGVDRALRRLLLLEGGAILAGTLVAAVLAAIGSWVALRPLDQVIATAEVTGSGTTGERLAPDRRNTELGRLASAFDDMLDRLDEALSRAQASDERSRRFLADAAHQLRSPLAAARAGAEATLAAGPGDGAQRERYLAQIAAETTRAGDLIRQLLLLARLDQGAATVTEQVDLADLARREAARMAALAPALAVDVDAPERLDVEADGDALAEAVANLLDNACRHARRTVTVRVAAGADGVVLGVSDDGPGLAPELVERAFERFSSLDGHGGTGLGLPIAREIARAHGGEVSYSDRGFVLSLPGGGPPVEA